MLVFGDQNSCQGVLGHFFLEISSLSVNLLVSGNGKMGPNKSVPYSLDEHGRGMGGGKRSKAILTLMHMLGIMQNMENIENMQN